MERTASGSKESEEGSGIGGKKKTKKKKRSVLANQSNPHHVDNCKLALLEESSADIKTDHPEPSLQRAIRLNRTLTTRLSCSHHLWLS